MKKKMILTWLILVIAVIGYFVKSIPEPDRCSMCANISRHALCVINLGTGEMLELDIYEPHPFLVGEIAEEQPGGYFSLIRGAGIEGHKVGAEYIVVSVPIKQRRINRYLFCNSCQKLLENERKSGFVLADLKYPEEPVVYSINDETKLDVRCYSVLVQEIVDKQEYEITVTGHYEK